MIIAFIDGSCEPVNPGGRMGIGVWINFNGQQKAFGEKIDESPTNSNNVAEYMALAKVIELCKDCDNEEIQIHSDSMLLVKQMNGEWRIKRGVYKETAIECMLGVTNLRANNKVKITWIPREQNIMADSLSQ